MPRPRSPHPKIKLHIALPQTTVARLHIRFASEDHAQGFPPGAISDFINLAILEKLERSREPQNSENTGV